MTTLATSATPPARAVLRAGRAVRPTSRPPGAPADGPTVRGIIERYLTQSASNNVHGKEAMSERVRTLGEFARDFGDLAVASLMPHHLSDWIDSHTRWKSSSTKRARAVMVNACFNWAASGRRIAENPMRSVHYHEAERRACMTDEEFAMLCEHSNKAFERAITFLRLTGCRLSDLCRLEWSHIDWERTIVILPKHKSVKKTGRPLVFALMPEAIALLTKIKAEHFHEGIVFRNTQGRPWDRLNLGQTLRRMKKILSSDSRATLHGIRHQFATTAIRNGAPLLFVSKQLGHASTAITEKYYVHVDDDVDGRMGAANCGKPPAKPQ